eukprot:CAMPEP_0197027392 /NCGR_PEP_ID=MMETSP1384-20130603/7302_1 /TAXON_ID=29189 /ORGANISM="Ammonia sp." /LENGTH=316 /DNA_ID=CAMNT_0042456227 /DNA_START=77 /DNA_END=1027 /DNA_ORIENTATION=-
MGTKQCIQAPRDEDESSSSDSDDDTILSPIKRWNNKIKMESKLHSVDFQCDPTLSFRRNIQNVCRRKRLPSTHELHTYNFYVWSSNRFGFGHDSIVIGSAAYRSEHDDNNYGWITAELCVDMDENKVLPQTRYLNKYEGLDFIETKKWKKQFSYTTTLNAVIDLVYKLIANHGTYNNLHNGCQHFVEGFLKKIIEYEHEYRVQTMLTHNRLYQSTSSDYVKGYQRYRACVKVEKQLKKERLSTNYEPMEQNLQIAGTLMVVPIVAMSVNKHKKYQSQRDKVIFQSIPRQPRHPRPRPPPPATEAGAARNAKRRSRE